MQFFQPRFDGYQYHLVYGSTKKVEDGLDQIRMKSGVAIIMMMWWWRLVALPTSQCQVGGPPHHSHYSVTGHELRDAGGCIYSCALLPRGCHEKRHTAEAKVDCGALEGALACEFGDALGGVFVAGADSCWPELVAPVAEARAWVGIGSGRTRWCGGGRLAGRGPGQVEGGRRQVTRDSRARGPGTRTPDSRGPLARSLGRWSRGQERQPGRHLSTG
jgi:hypothetical protein